uniref:Uncharacterized protein n=1 Tax=Zea mays TaxID=4577 RepID=C4J8P2_MAIZE|nr:unknown [Zea mays]
MTNTPYMDFLHMLIEYFVCRFNARTPN